jgi:dTDP-4-dehydrorhamnose reductase
MIPKIIFSDVDGTLLNSDHKVLPGTVYAIRELKKKGIPFVIISARSPSGIRPILEENNFTCPMISYSGALILDEDENVLYSEGFSREDAAEMVRFIESNQLDKCGIYHCSNEGVCSWYVFACEIARLSGNSGCEVKPCTTADYPTRAQRPQYSVLNKNKFTTTFGIVIPDWKDSLKKVIK